MNTWPVFYYKKLKYIYFLIFIPAILAVFVPSIVMNIDRGFFKKYEWIFEKAIFIAMGIFIAGLIIVLILKSIKRKSTLTVENGNVCFLNKCISLSNATITLGKYGIPAAGAQGSALHIREGKKLLKIGILYYTAENANHYTEDWTMNVDCFVDREDIEALLAAIEKKQKIETEYKNPFNRNEQVFELRRAMGILKTFFIFYAFLAIPIITLAVLQTDNYILSMLLVFTGFGGFIYFIIKKGKKGTGYYMTIENNTVSFLHLVSRKEIFTTPLNNIITDTYIIKLTGRHTSFTYLTLKLKIPGFKNITIGQTGPWGQNIWKDKNIKEKWWAFTPPDYIVDAETWNKLAKNFNNTFSATDFY